MRTVDVIPLLRFPWNAPPTFTYRVPDDQPLPLMGSWANIFFRGKKRSAIIAGSSTLPLPRTRLLYLASLAHDAPLPHAYMGFIEKASRATFNHPARFLMSPQLKIPPTLPPPRVHITRTPTSPLLVWWTRNELRYTTLLARAKKFQRAQHLILSPTIEEAKALHSWLCTHHIPAILFQPRAPASHQSMIAQTLLAGKPFTVVGTRASLFLPFSHLTAITVDFEEHWAYDQTTPPPRYHGRSLSFLLAQMHRANHLLLSPAPSLESLTRTKTSPPPHSPGYAVELIDTTSFNHFQEPIAPHLFARMRETLRLGAPVMVITPEKGFAPSLSCRDCRFLFRCPDCHRVLGSETSSSKELICNRCGYLELTPPLCPHCQSPRLTLGGFGPTRLMEFLRKNEMNASLLRQGTQQSASCLVAKFYESIPHSIQPSLIAVTDADPLLARTGFSATMNAFQEFKRMQLFAQHTQAALILQTSTPRHPVFSALVGTVKDFYDEELRLRKIHHYPPFTTLVRITLPGATEKDRKIAEHVHANLTQSLAALSCELLSSPKTHRRRRRVLTFTLRYPKPEIPAPMWSKITALLKQTLPAKAIIDTEPESV